MASRIGEKIPGWVERLLIPTLESKVRSVVKEEVGQLEKVMDAKFQGVDARLQAMDSRLEGVDAKFQGMYDRLDGLEEKFDARFDTVDAKIDSLEKRLPLIQDLAEIKSRLTQVEKRTT